MRYIPLDVARVIYMPNRKIYLLSLTLAEETKPIGFIVSKLNEINADIITIYGYCMNGAGHLSIIVDLTKADADISKLIDILRKLKYVTHVGYVEPEEQGLLIDKYHFPITHGGGRAVLFDMNTLYSMFDEIKRQWGSAGEAFIYYLGNIGGKGFAQHFTNKYKELGFQKIYKIMRDTIQAYGFCIMDKIEQIGDEYLVRVKELFECKPVEGKRTEPNSHFFRGFISGIASILLGREMLAEEVKCIAKGDEYCEFIIRERKWRKKKSEGK